MNCLQCANLDLQKHPKHALVGLGQCKLQRLSGVFESFIKERNCALFVAATPEIVQKRVDWWKDRK